MKTARKSDSQIMQILSRAGSKNLKQRMQGSRRCAPLRG